MDKFVVKMPAVSSTKKEVPTFCPIWQLTIELESTPNVDWHIGPVHFEHDVVSFIFVSATILLKIGRLHVPSDMKN